MKGLKAAILGATVIASLAVAPSASADHFCDTVVGPTPVGGVSFGSTIGPHLPSGACVNIFVNGVIVGPFVSAELATENFIAGPDVSTFDGVCFTTFCVLVGAGVFQEWYGIPTAQAAVCYVDNLQTICIPRA